MLQNFDRGVVRINSWRERLPPCFRRAHELGLRRVVRNAPVKPPYLKAHQPQIGKQEDDSSNVSATYPGNPFSPFYLPHQLQTAAAPTFRLKIQFNRCRRQFDADYLRGASKYTLYCIKQLIEGFV